MEITNLDMSAWERAWGELPADRREVYIHPRYAAVCGRWEAARPGCLRADAAAGGGWMLYPYLVHPAGDGDGDGGGGACDVQTPYGYGGPLFVGAWSADEKAAALAGAMERFRALGAVAEFVRCHTHWSDGQALAGMGFTVFQVRTNVECEFAGGDLTATWAAGARRNLRKAQAAGLRYRLGSPDADLAAFERLYALSAARLDMTPGYRFDHAYFRGLVGLDGVKLIVVETPDALAVAAAIVFVGGRVAHYHLGASDFAYQERRPNDFLYFAMADVARAAGCERIVWGGGMSNDADDTLFRFKSHFGDVRRPAFCAGRVIDRGGYDRLCTLWQERNPERASKLFLKYRA